MKKISLPQILGLSLIIDIIIFDQISKWAVMELILRPELTTDGRGLGFMDWIMNPPLRMEFISIPIMPSFNLTMVWNHGVSFGLFRDLGIWPLVIAAAAVSTIFGFWLMRTKSVFESVALSFVVGGAIGNIIDRFRFGAVADFLDVYVGSYHWPAFNIADSAITIGVAMLLVHGLFLKEKDSVE
jgi:signal peptidase II